LTAPSLGLPLHLVCGSGDGWHCEQSVEAAVGFGAILASVVSFKVGRLRPMAMAQHNKRRNSGAKVGSPASMAYCTSRKT